MAAWWNAPADFDCITVVRCGLAALALQSAEPQADFLKAIFYIQKERYTNCCSANEPSLQ